MAATAAHHPPAAAPPAADRVAALEAELASMSRDLTRRVAERTAELTQANEKLYAELLGRRAAEQSLRAAEEKYRGFFEHAVEGAYQSTPKGQYLSVNPALARLYGYDSVTDLLANISNIARDLYVDPFMRTRFKDMIEHDGEVHSLEYQVRRRDGTPIWISENARVARGRRGRVLYYEGTVQDITRRKQAEAEAAALSQQLLQAQKMEAVGTLAGGVAHDFNNILGAILGYTELALDDVPAGTPTAANLAEVLKAAHRARDHVRQILAFSRHSLPERKPVRVGAIVREALGLVRATIPSTIRIAADIAEDHDHAVADAAQLHQVIVNLCTNASHAMRGRDGVLTVTLDRVALGPPPRATAPRLTPGDYLRLRVRDTGHGIPPEVLPRIFEPFFTTKPVGEGTGLGLSVVHGIVQGHGGEIEADNAPDGGALFTVHLPATAALVQIADVPPTPRPGHGERILLVDDEEPLALVLQQILERLGYVALAHTCSRTALAALRADPAAFDLVITDQTMANITGLQLATAIREIRANLPIVLSTGYADLVTPAEAAQVGIVGFLPKPAALAELSQVIAAALHPARATAPT